MFSIKWKNVPSDVLLRFTATGGEVGFPGCGTLEFGHPAENWEDSETLLLFYLIPPALRSVRTDIMDFTIYLQIFTFTLINFNVAELLFGDLQEIPVETGPEIEIQNNGVKWNLIPKEVRVRRPRWPIVLELKKGWEITKPPSQYRPFGFLAESSSRFYYSDSPEEAIEYYCHLRDMLVSVRNEQARR